MNEWSAYENQIKCRSNRSGAVCISITIESGGFGNILHRDLQLEQNLRNNGIPVNTHFSRALHSARERTQPKVKIYQMKSFKFIVRRLLR